jgi:hypothetical protein
MRETVISHSIVRRVAGSSSLTWNIIERSVWLVRAVGSNRDIAPLLVFTQFVMVCRNTV